MLSPRPRDFTAGVLGTADVVKALTEGRPGTAMKSFRGLLSDDEMQAVAAFVVDEFVTRKAGNSAYHTAENGWPEHRQRYAAAYPYVLGEARADGPSTPGSRLYLSACITCHQPEATAPTWEAGPR